MNRHVVARQFIESVEKKFRFLDSVFLGLPLRGMPAGKLLSEFHEHVAAAIDTAETPGEIIDSFFPRDMPEETVIGNLFQVIKYVEREVVLFDAVEDAAFDRINNLYGPNSLAFMISNAIAEGKSAEIVRAVSEIRVRLVLTAHPTQFYPGTILGIINDLQDAIHDNELGTISTLLQQLSYTPFFKKEKPTPYDEALSLVWYLENVFYDAILAIQEILFNELPGDREVMINPRLIELGFWPGGDRDGNPFVTAETSLKVAHRLRASIFQKYHDEVRMLRRRLTFRPFMEPLKKIENCFLAGMLSEGKPELSARQVISMLEEIQDVLHREYDDIYRNDVERLIHIIRIFGYHFATLDIRQDRNTHRGVLMEILESQGRHEEYLSLDDASKADFLESMDTEHFELRSERGIETIKSLKVIRDIQEINGEEGCNRYIISNCTGEVDVLELMALFRCAGWKAEELTVDIVPLFETVSDLENCSRAMTGLYRNRHYSSHLGRRNKQQTIMLGFSDGTKDGGYFTANWSIYRAKEALTAVARDHDMEVTFFDGRGGPAARGGGKTHNYYASHGRSIENRRVHLTVQGQTISSNFGTAMSARYNMEQLVSACVKNSLFEHYRHDPTPAERELMDRISRMSHDAYARLRDHEQFTDYMVHRTAMLYYGKTNIGSRPDRRKEPEKFTLRDLRAIPFVASWAMNKQNIPGFYGFGHALSHMLKKDAAGELQELFRNSLFFRTLVENSMMVLKKSNFRLTRHSAHDEEYHELWQMLFDEFNRAHEALLEVSGYPYLMAGNPKDQLSIELREKTVLPLCVIQQYALCRLDELKKNGGSEQSVERYTKMVIRSSYGIINAARNYA